MQNTQVMVGWKHEMIISGLQKKMAPPVWAIIDEFGVHLSAITSQNGLFIEKLILTNIRSESSFDQRIFECEISYSSGA